MRAITTTTLAAALLASAGAPAVATDTQATMNTLTPQQQAEGWTLLFDGETTSGWRGYRGDSMPAGWSVVDGALTRTAQAGDIVTVDEYGDFDLVFDWKIQHGGNSGVMYRVTEDADEPYETGPEYQLLDDPNYPDGKSLLTSAGSVFGLYAIPRHLARAAGEWNHARILVRDGHVEHWLNGVKAAEYQLGGEDFRQRVQDSKFRQWPGFGKAASGHIDLQDHGFEVAFRNMRIRRL